MQESKSQSAGGLVDDAPLDMDLYNTPAVAAAAREMEIHASSDNHYSACFTINAKKKSNFSLFFAS